MWQAIPWFWFIKIIVVIDLIKFLMTRWQSFSINVKANIERYNQISQRNSDGALLSSVAVCKRCNSVNDQQRPDSLNVLSSLPTINLSDINSETTTPTKEADVIVNNEQLPKGLDANVSNKLSAKEPDAIVQNEQSSKEADVIVNNTNNQPNNEQPSSPSIEQPSSPSVEQPSSPISIEPKVTNKYKLRRVISFTETKDDDSVTNHEDIRILEICRTKNLVSKLTKKFEGAITKNITGSHFKRLNDDFINKSFKRTSSKYSDQKSPETPTVNGSEGKDYFVIEKTEIFEVKDTVKPNLSPLIITKRSHSIGEITRNRKSSPSTPVTPIIIGDVPPKLQKSMENILEHDDWIPPVVQMRNHVENKPWTKCVSVDNVTTVEDILQQERFSKCFSEYSISDLLNDLPDDDDDIELTEFLNKIL